MSLTLEETRVCADDFKYAFRNHPAGVAVVTASGASGQVAMTVSSLSSVSIDPPTLVFSASAISSSTPALREAETVVVHLVSSDQVDLAKLGATSGVDRFGEGVEWGVLESGEPYYPAASAWLRCRVVQRLELSGAILVVAEAIQGKPRGEEEPNQARPLVYHNRTWHALGNQSEIV